MVAGRWNLSSLFAGDDDPAIQSYRKEIQERVAVFVARWEKRTDFLSDPAVLAQALQEYEALEIVGPSGADGEGTKDGFYFWLRSQQEQANSLIKAKYAQAQEFSVEISNQLRFFLLALGTISIDNKTRFLASPLLRRYCHFLERIFAQATHNLSPAEESLLALKKTPAHDMWDQLVSGLLAKQEREILTESGERKKLPFSEITSLLNSTQKQVRDEAAQAFNAVLAQYAEIAEGELNALLANKKIDDMLRHFARPDSARHLTDDIDTAVVDALVASVSARFDLTQRFYRLKAALFGVPVLAYHERNVPYGKTDKRYSFDEACTLVRKVFGKLDPQFEQLFVSFLTEGRIDVLPAPGKRSGAFCTDSLKYQPTFILLNYTGQLREVATFAHELGHGINGELMKRSCSTLDCGMALSTAEVASTFMEDFVFEELLRTASPEERLALLHDRVQDELITIVRQIAAYRFEQVLHMAFRAEGYLSAERIGNLFQEHMKAYMGDAVEQSLGSHNWWIHWHHFRTFFYVYSYASGLLISKALQAKVRADPVFIGQVKQFLSAGMSASPAELFLRVGIDISQPSFWELGLQEIERELDELETLAHSLGTLPSKGSVK